MKAWGIRPSVQDFYEKGGANALSLDLALYAAQLILALNVVRRVVVGLTQTTEQLICFVDALSRLVSALRSFAKDN